MSADHVIGSVSAVKQQLLNAVTDLDMILSSLQQQSAPSSAPTKQIEVAVHKAHVALQNAIQTTADLETHASKHIPSRAFLHGVRWDALPEEVLSKIFFESGLPCDCFPLVRGVCVSWSSAFNRSVKELVLIAHPPHSNKHKPLAVLFPALTSVNASRLPRDLHAGWTNLLATLDQLTRLSGLKSLTLSKESICVPRSVLSSLKAGSVVPRRAPGHENSNELYTVLALPSELTALSTLNHLQVVNAAKGDTLEHRSIHDTPMNRYTTQTPISCLSPLSNITTLKSLHLFAPLSPREVNNLSTLTELRMLSGQHMQTGIVPRLPFLTALRSLTIERIYNFQGGSFSVSSVLEKLTGLTRLALRESHIMEVPPSISQLRHIEILDLSHNKLQRVGAHLRNLPALRTLHLYLNQLALFPDMLVSLPSLAEVHLGSALHRPQNTSHNSALQAFCMMPSLTKVSLAAMRLHQIPSQILFARPLSVLDLTNNHLTAIPSAISTLTCLEVLLLPANDLPSLPYALSTLTSIHTLDVSRNKHLTALHLPTSLTCLMASDCALPLLPHSMRRCIRLAALNLSDSFLLGHSWQDLSPLTNLTRLILDNLRQPAPPPPILPNAADSPHTPKQPTGPRQPNPSNPFNSPLAPANPNANGAPPPAGAAASSTPNNRLRPPPRLQPSMLQRQLSLLRSPMSGPSALPHNRPPQGPPPHRSQDPNPPPHPPFGSSFGQVVADHMSNFFSSFSAHGMRSGGATVVGARGGAAQGSTSRDGAGGLEAGSTGGRDGAGGVDAGGTGGRDGAGAAEASSSGASKGKGPAQMASDGGRWRAANAAAMKGLKEGGDAGPSTSAAGCSRHGKGPVGSTGADVAAAPTAGGSSRGEGPAVEGGRAGLAAGADGAAAPTASGSSRGKGPAVEGGPAGPAAGADGAAAPTVGGSSRGKGPAREELGAAGPSTSVAAGGSSSAAGCSKGNGKGPAAADAGSAGPSTSAAAAGSATAAAATAAATSVAAGSSRGKGPAREEVATAAAAGSSRGKGPAKSDDDEAERPVWTTSAALAQASAAVAEASASFVDTLTAMDGRIDEAGSWMDDIAEHLLQRVCPDTLEHMRPRMGFRDVARMYDPYFYPPSSRHPTPSRFSSPAHQVPSSAPPPPPASRAPTPFPLPNHPLLQTLSLSGRLGANTPLTRLSILTHLRSLNLSRCDLGSKGQADNLLAPIYHLVQLTQLDLSVNSLVRLDTGISMLTMLRQLDASSNALCDLPGEIWALRKLRLLYLTANYLTELPELTAANTTLQVLDLRHNRLQGLPSSSTLLKGLMELQMDTPMEQLQAALSLRIRGCHVTTNNSHSLPKNRLIREEPSMDFFDTQIGQSMLATTPRYPFFPEAHPALMGGAPMNDFFFPIIPHHGGLQAQAIPIPWNEDAHLSDDSEEIDWGADDEEIEAEMNMPPPIAGGGLNGMAGGNPIGQGAGNANGLGPAFDYLAGEDPMILVDDSSDSGEELDDAWLGG